MPRAVAQIDIFDDGSLAQRGELQPGDEPSVVALGDLAIDHEAEPLLEGERLAIGLAQLIVEGLGHAGEVQRHEAFVAGIGEHEVSFSRSVVVVATADVGVADGLGVGSGLG
jgi:hypothetical protein